MIITKTNLYDSGRLFLFTIPFFATVGSIGLYYIVVKLKDSNFIYKSFSFIVLFLFILSFYRFIFLTPYQYSYVNFSYFKIKDSINKFEHDYWATSFKELVTKIKNVY